MKRQVRACAILMVAVMTGCCTERIVPPAAKDRATVVKGAWRPTLPSAWKGKKVAFLGDSITDPAHVGCTANYWNYLPDLLGIDAYVYGKNGWRMDGMLTQAEWLKNELGDEVDAIFVLAGTNDYNGSVPRGEWYEEREETVNRSDGPARLKHRVLSMNATTFRGRLNRLLGYLKHNFPRQQIVLMTALHRGYATFGPANVQPDETFGNLRGEFIDDFNADIREAGRRWSVPVLDLFERCGLYPNEPEHVPYFHRADTDMLHPSAAGHRRIAETMAYWMLTIPPGFDRPGVPPVGGRES